MGSFYFDFLRAFAIVVIIFGIGVLVYKGIKSIVGIIQAPGNRGSVRDSTSVPMSKAVYGSRADPKSFNPTATVSEPSERVLHCTRTGQPLVPLPLTASAVCHDLTKNPVYVAGSSWVYHLREQCQHMQRANPSTQKRMLMCKHCADEVKSLDYWITYAGNSSD